jgi:hypothetical protein
VEEDVMEEDMTADSRRDDHFSIGTMLLFSQFEKTKSDRAAAVRAARRGTPAVCLHLRNHATARLC